MVELFPPDHGVALHSPSYGTEIRRGLALELLLSVEMFTAGETGGAEGIAVEVSVRDPGVDTECKISLARRDRTRERTPMMKNRNIISLTFFCTQKNVQILM